MSRYTYVMQDQAEERVARIMENALHGRQANQPALSKPLIFAGLLIFVNLLITAMVP